MRKSMEYLRIVWLALLLFPGGILLSQEEGKNNFSAGADFYSSYIWRGTKYGTGPHIQPLVKFNSGIFTAGGWGSFDFSGYQEADLFFSLALPAGFSLGMTDYYYPGFDYFDFSESSGSHAFEVNGGFSKGGLALAGNIIVNEAGGAGSSGGDLYFQAGYTFKSFNLLVGAGDGWHTSNGNFNVCNIGFGTTRTIKVTESFSIPVTGQIIINPERQKMYIVIGFTL
jgi:hypothetical protein